MISKSIPDQSFSSFLMARVVAESFSLGSHWVLSAVMERPGRCLGPFLHVNCGVL